MSESKKLKTIAFDLDTKLLEKHYTKGDWHNAYNDIKIFMKANDFIWQQGSVYDSTTKMTSRELGDLIDKIGDNFDWFSQSIRSIRGYDQPKMIDYTKQLKNRHIKVDKSIINTLRHRGDEKDY